MNKIFIGYDKNEIVAYHTCLQSIIENTKTLFEFIPLHTSFLSKVYTRKYDPLQSTDFTYSRFLVPYLSHYSGYSIFVDCDFIFEDDVLKLFENIEKYDIMVVKQPEYTSKVTNKFLNKNQTVFKRKNWSSLIVFNNEKCKQLTPDYVNSADPKELHRFKWLDDSRIGELQNDWNHLVDEFDNIETPKGIHYTLGGPYFKSHENCSYSENWKKYHERINYVNNGI